MRFLSLGSLRAFAETAKSAWRSAVQSDGRPESASASVVRTSAAPSRARRGETVKPCSEGECMNDLITLIEDTYRLEADEDAWLTSILKSCMALGLGDRGVIGFLFDIREGAPSVMLPPITVEAHPMVAQAATRAMTSMPRAEQVRYLTKGPTVTTGRALANDVKPSNAAMVAEIRKKLGWEETFGMRIVDVSGVGLSITGMLSSVRTYSPTTLRTWRRVAAHLGAALRLRRALSGCATTPEPAAIFDWQGTVHHARGDARSKGQRAALREAVLAVARAKGPLREGDPDAAVRAWQALVAGRWSLVDRFESDGRRYAVIHENVPTAPDPRGLSTQERAVAHYAALGQSNKQIAYTLGLAEGTVAAVATRAQRKLAVASRAALYDQLFGPAVDPVTATTDAVAIGGERVRVVSWSDGAGEEALRLLSDAEREVVRAVLAGMSNEEIAASRGTASRTIANQLASIFQKLGVSSRAELSARLNRASGSGQGEGTKGEQTRTLRP